MSKLEENKNKSNSWWALIEKRIKQLVMLLIVLLIVVQAIFMNHELRWTFSGIERLEGKSIEVEQAYIMRGNVELSITSSYRGVAPDIYINGKKTAAFINNTASITVKNNDIIEVSSVNSDEAIEIKVTGLSSGVTEPALGKTFKISKNIVIVGKAKLR